MRAASPDRLSPERPENTQRIRYLAAGDCSDGCHDVVDGM